MFNFFKKSKDKDKSNKKNEQVSIKEEQNHTALVSLNSVKQKNDKKNANQEEKKARFDGIKEYAKLSGEKESDVNNDVNVYLLKKYFSKIGKVIVRFGITDEEMEKTLLNCYTLGFKQVLVAPAYLSTCNRISKKLFKEGKKLTERGALIDFPFGGSTYKSKITDIKDSIRQGAEDISVMMPTVLLSGTNRKDFKYQVKKTGKIKRGGGIALNGSDLTEEEIICAIKLIEKTKLGHLTFAFGDISLTELTKKMKIIGKCRKKKEVRILCNAQSAMAVTKLLSLGADAIYTPFAEKIAKELINKFQVKGLNLQI